MGLSGLCAWVGQLLIEAGIEETVADRGVLPDFARDINGFPRALSQAVRGLASSVFAPANTCKHPRPTQVDAFGHGLVGEDGVPMFEQSALSADLVAIVEIGGCCGDHEVFVVGKGLLEDTWIELIGSLIPCVG